MTDIRRLISKYSVLKEISEKYSLDNEIDEFICSNTKLLENSFNNSQNDEFNITVIAPMKAGKSSFINSLIKKDLLPNENEACTFFPIEIKVNDSDENIYRVYKDGTKELAGDRKSYSKLHDDIRKIRNGEIDPGNINRYTLGYKFENLSLPENIKINIIDLPGINEAQDKSNVNILSMFNDTLKNSSQIIYLFDIQYYKSSENIDILNSIKLCRPDLMDNILFITTKIDLFDYEKGKSIEDTKDDIKKILKQINIINPSIIECSSKKELIGNEIEKGLVSDKKNILYNLLNLIKIKYANDISKRISKAEKAVESNYEYISKNIDLKKIDTNGKSIFMLPEPAEIADNMKQASNFRNVENKIQHIIDNTKEIKDKQLENVIKSCEDDFIEVTSVIKEESLAEIDNLSSSKELNIIEDLQKKCESINSIKAFKSSVSISADEIEESLLEKVRDEIRNMKVTAYYDTEWYEYSDLYSIEQTTPGGYKENMELEAAGNYNRLINSLSNSTSFFIDTYKGEVISDADKHVSFINEQLKDIYSSVNITFNNKVVLNFNENSIYSVDVPRIFTPYVQSDIKHASREVGWFNKRTEYYWKYRLRNIGDFKNSCKDEAYRTVEKTAKNIYNNLSRHLADIINKNINQQLNNHKKMLQQIIKDKKESAKDIYDEIDKLNKLIDDVDNCIDGREDVFISQKDNNEEFKKNESIKQKASDLNKEIAGTKKNKEIASNKKKNKSSNKQNGDGAKEGYESTNKKDNIIVRFIKGTIRFIYLMYILCLILGNIALLFEEGIKQGIASVIGATIPAIFFGMAFKLFKKKRILIGKSFKKRLLYYLIIQTVCLYISVIF